MKFISKAALVGAGILMASGSALAATPYPNVVTGGNKWRMTFYNDTTTNHASLGPQDICVSTTVAAKGMGITGVWYSTTYPDWNGRYYQEGDKLRLYGDFSSNTGHSHGICEFINYTLATCTFDEWREDSAYGTFANLATVKLERIGTCAFTAAATAVAANSMTLAGEKTSSPSSPK